MKSFLTATIFLCTAAAGCLANDGKPFKTVQLGGGYTLIVTMRNVPTLPDKNGKTDPMVGTTDYFEFIVEHGGKQTSLGEVEMVGVIGGDPLAVTDTFHQGDRIGFVYSLAGFRVPGGVPAAAVCAAIDHEGGVHLLKETLLDGSPGGGNFHVSSDGIVSLDVKWSEGIVSLNAKRSEINGKETHEKSAHYELDAAGEFVKK